MVLTRNGLRKILIVSAILLLNGCASSPIRIGSEGWHKNRYAEIEEAYQNKEIDKAEYIELKNETDAIRADYLDRRDQVQSHIGYYGHKRGHGTSVGVGVGF